MSTELKYLKFTNKTVKDCIFQLLTLCSDESEQNRANIFFMERATF